MTMGLGIGLGLPGSVIRSMEEDVKVIIERITNTIADEFDFNNIPDKYKRLVIEGYIRSTDNVVGDDCLIVLNESVLDGQYHSQDNRTFDGAALLADSNNNKISTAVGTSAPADTYTDVRITIENYSNSAARKNVVGYLVGLLDTGKLVTGNFAVSSAITDAITRVRIRTDNHSGALLFGELTLYGEK